MPHHLHKHKHLSKRSLDKRKKVVKRSHKVKSVLRGKVRFLVSFVLFHVSNVTYWKRYSTFPDKIMAQDLKYNRPLSSMTIAFDDFIREHKDYEGIEKQVVIICYAYNRRIATYRALNWDNFRNIESDDEFEIDVEAYRKFAHGRIYKRLNA